MKRDVENAADARMPGDAAEDAKVKPGAGKALAAAMMKARAAMTASRAKSKRKPVSRK